MRSTQLAEALTASEPISTALEDGSIVQGTLGFHPSRRGRFKVSYAGKSKMEMRSYMGIEHMRSGAMTLLREMADAQRVQSTPAKPTKSKSGSKKKRGLAGRMLVQLSKTSQDPPMPPDRQGAR